MKTSYTVLSWNINRRGGQYPIHNIVLNTLLSLNQDINILTEYTYNNSKDFNHTLWTNNYVPLGSDKKFKKGHNDVLIAIKQNIVEQFDNIEINWFEEKPDYPNFLQVTLKKENLVIHVIGVRVKIKDCSAEDCKNRKKQIDNLLKYLDSLEGRIIIAGDFNNLKHEEKDTIQTFQNRGLVREFYNYPMLKNAFEKSNFTFLTPDNGISWYGGINNQCKLDHVAGRNIQINNVEYNWDFLKENNAHEILEKKHAKNGPDHAILLAEMELEG